jgi:CTP:molybdopterin cytidylyltransferase MocA
MDADCARARAPLTRPVIVLAGGRSSRMGEPKGLVAVRGRPWLEHQLESVAACGCTRAIVVLGHAKGAYLAALPWLAGRLASPRVDTEPTTRESFAGLAIDIVMNDAPERGTFSSVQCGARAVLANGDAAGAFVLPVDVPCAEARVWEALDAACTGDVLASVPRYASRGGHPVACSHALLASLVALDPAAADARLDVQLRSAHVAPRVIGVPVSDARVIANLNTPDDWATITG